MNEYFIKNIEIKNFKLFKDFKAEGFGRVNLIGGKNNVGKTAFMEAVYVNASSKTISNLLFALSEIDRNREKLNLALETTNIINMLAQYKFFVTNAINKIKYEFNDNTINKKLIVELNDKIEEINFNQEISFTKNKNVIFIDNYGFTNHELKEIYKAVQFQDKDILIDDYLKEFDSDILKFKIIDSYPYIKDHSDQGYKKLSEFGDGTKKYISIISSIFASKGCHLFIDEIDNGIHYTKLDRLWEIILTVSKEQNVQVFATTHSKECIESYARVAKRLGDEEIGFIELGRNKFGKLDSIVFDSERFHRFMELGNEVRGW